VRGHTVHTSMTLLGLVLWGCSTPPGEHRAQRVSAEAAVGADEPTQPKVEGATAGETVALAPSAPLPPTDAWIKAMLDQAEAGGAFMERVKFDQVSPGTACTGTCLMSVSEEDRFLFIDAGYCVLPKLIRHIRDDRRVCCFFYTDCLSSSLQVRSEMVGKIACFLIEAVLREDPYFTWSWRFLYDSPAAVSEIEAEKHALYQAASAYEQWFDKCFDEQACRVTCWPEELPVVKWDYHPEWWGDWGSCRDLRCGSESVAKSEIIGKTVTSSRAGREGYILMLSDGGWLSCFVSGTNQCWINWRHSARYPPDGLIARLGPLRDADDEDGFAREVSKAHGKILKCFSRDQGIGPVFEDGSKLCAMQVWDVDTKSCFMRAQLRRE